jgi:hypothetical protein
LANRVETSNRTVFSLPIEQYISTAYVQSEYNSTTKQTVMTYYNSTACGNIMSPTDLRYANLEGYNCPDMPAESKIYLQGALAVPILRED